MRKELENQIDKIMDESSGSYADVIVQFRSEQDEALSKLLEAAVETERNRAMVVDPFNILPPESKAFTGTKTARRKLRGQQASLVANIALDSAVSLMTPTLGISSPLISHFLNSQEVKSAISTIQNRLKSKASRAEPQSLPNIGGARVMVNRGDLPNILASQQEVIEGVYENAKIKAPRVFETAAVEDESNSYAGTTWALEQTKALSAWSTFGTKGEMKDGSKVRVAVLDTGVDPNHPDISPRLIDFAELDQSGKVVKQGLAAARDSGRHGTHVSGTIVGGNASGGWIGMAPEAELIVGLVLDGDKGGTLAQVIGGIDWAVNSGAHVINMSLGGLTFSSSVGTPYQRAIVNALARGSLIVAAIGNDGHQTTGAPGNDYFSLAIGAHDQSGRCAGFSGGRTLELNQSNIIDNKFLPLIYTKPDLSAPGVGVKSSVPKNKWASFNGTSMATPHVSGAAALLYGATDLANHTMSERAFVARDLLLGGVKDAGEAGQDQRFGYGTLNVLRSIDEALKRGF